ncbi:MAG: helix-turn-helix domain-containing protein [Chitinophagaceae bacterium]
MNCYKITTGNNRRVAFLRHFIIVICFAKLPVKWYNFDTSITKYTSMKESKKLKMIRDVLSNPRKQKDELQALQDTIYVIGGKWKLPIINSICNGNKRFREIERSIPGITTRMLSRELKEMEANQLINRTVTPDSPVLVEYTATDYCRSFGDIILEMITWGKSHRKRIIRSPEDK